MNKANTVWIVDDDRSIRWVLEKALNQAGIRTEVFDSAEAIGHELTHAQPRYRRLGAVVAYGQGFPGASRHYYHRAFGLG